MTVATTGDVTDEHWEMLDNLIPEKKRHVDGRGRPWKNRRAGLEWHSLGVTHRCSVGGYPRALSVLPDLPPPISTVGPLRCDERCPGSACVELKSRGEPDVQEAFIDGSLLQRKKGL